MRIMMMRMVIQIVISMVVKGPDDNHHNDRD